MTRPQAPEPLQESVIDSHCHMDIPYGEEHILDVDEALRAARNVGVNKIVQTGFDLRSSRWSVQVAQSHDDVVAAVALHPNEAPRIFAEDGESALTDAIAEIDALASDPKVRAVGETGMDFFRTGPEGREIQERSFREHIRIAKKHDRTLVIHDRDSHDDVIRILLDEGAPSRVMFHCFSGDEAMAKICADHGWYLSFAGTVTYKNAQNLRDALLVTPLDRIVVETDAPFLPPVPYRGQPNASYLIPLTLRFMAQTLGTTAEDLGTSVRQNTFRLFGGAW